MAALTLLGFPHDALVHFYWQETTNSCKAAKILLIAPVTLLIALLAPIEAVVRWLLVLLVTPFAPLFKATLKQMYEHPLLSLRLCQLAFQFLGQIICALAGYLCCRQDLRTHDQKEREAAIDAVTARYDADWAAASQLREFGIG